MSAPIFVLLIVWTTSCAVGDSGVSSADLKKLKHDLLDGYDKTISPILYSKEVHTSGIFLHVLRIRDLDETKGELTVEGPVGFNWEDARLMMNSTKRMYIHFSPDELWKPTLNILNRLEPDELTLNAQMMVFRRSLWWAPRYVLHTSCTPNLKFYPFDKQTCPIEIMAIAQEDEIIVNNYTTADLRSFGYVGNRNITENIRWKFISASGKQEIRKLNIGLTATVEIFIITIQRTMPLIALCLLTPGIISIILLLSTFWISPGDSIRVGINVTSMIVCSSSLFSVAKCLPATGKVTPIIVEYAATSLILTAISSIQAILVTVLVRLDEPPDVSYFKYLLVFPPWFLRTLGLAPEVKEETSTDQDFLFSELAENVANENNAVADTTTSTKDIKTISKKSWTNVIILFERISFYVYLLVIGLFILSVMINE